MIAARRINGIHLRNRQGDMPQVSTWHSPDTEMRAIWHPIITVRDGDDLAPLLELRRPFTVVKDTP